MDVSSLLIVMVTTTLTLVLISHRLRDDLKKKKEAKKDITDAKPRLDYINLLIFAHIFSSTLIIFRIMFTALFCESTGECLIWLDTFIFVWVFFILGVCWPTYFYLYSDGKATLLMPWRLIKMQLDYKRGKSR